MVNPWAFAAGIPALQGGEDVKYVNEIEGEGRGRTGRKKNPDANMTWVAFDARQIKSAIGNNGKFSPDNPDITDRVTVAAQDARDYLAGLVKKAALHV